MITPEQHISVKLNELLSLTDALMLEKGRIKNGIIALSTELVELDTKGEDTKEGIRAYKGFIQRDYMINQDLNRTVDSIGVLFDIAKVTEITLELDENNMKRAASMHSKNAPIFVLQGDKIEYFDPKTEEALIAATLKAEEANPSANAQFLQNLKVNAAAKEQSE